MEAIVKVPLKSWNHRKYYDTEYHNLNFHCRGNLKAGMKRV